MIYSWNLLKELKLELRHSTPFFMDAMSAIQALRNPTYHARTKHIAVKWHWLAQHIGVIFELIHVRTGDMTADLLTKAAVLRIWLGLFPHLSGAEQRSSREVIEAQSRERDVAFPRGKGSTP